MKKLTLDLDQLRVESFSTAETGAEKGTVHGHLGTGGGCTVYDSCDGSVCGGSCAFPCGGGSGHYTCGIQAACGNSIELCRTDMC